MIELKYPELIFDRTKIYKVGSNNGTLQPIDFGVKSPKIVLIFDGSSEKMSEAINQMLAKLVTACGFEETEKLLINSAEYQLSLSDIQNRLCPKLVLLFGEIKLGGNIAGLKMNTPALLGGNVFIKADSLNKLVNHDAGKATLWKGIKQALTLIK
jgi:hypothetical protein